MATQDVDASPYKSESDACAKYASTIAEGVCVKIAAELAPKITTMLSVYDMDDLELLVEDDRCANRLIAHYSAEMAGKTDGMVDHLFDGRVKHDGQGKRKRPKTEEPLEPSPADTLQAMKKYYIDHLVKKQQRLLLRAQTEFTDLETSREVIGCIAVMHDLLGIRDNSEDAELAASAKELHKQIFILGGEHDSSNEPTDAGLELLDEIAKAKRALKTLEKLRSIAEESDI